LWNPYASFPVFSDNALWLAAPAIAIASALDISTEWFVKGLILGVLILSGLSMYYAANILIKEFHKNKRIAFSASITAALVYMFNPWMLPHITHLWMWAAYAITPLVLICFMKSLKTGKLTYVIATALLWSLASTTAHYLVFVGILIFSWLVFSLITREIGKSTALNQVKVTSLTVFFFLAFNTFWLIPHLASGAITSSYMVTTDSIEFISKNGSPLNVIRFMGFWEPASMTFYQPSSQLLYYPWLIGSFMVPLFAFASLLLKPKNKSAFKYVLYFALMTIPLIFLAMGTKSPFPSVYNWLVFDIPFFSEKFGWLFREPDRWVGILALMFCFLIAFTISGIFQRGWKNPTRVKLKSIPIVTTLVFVSFFGLFAAPAAGHWMGDYLVPHEVPEEFQATNEWLEEQSGDFKVSWLPEHAGQTTWGVDYLNRGFYNWTISAKTHLMGIPSFTPFTQYYYDYIYRQSLLNNRTAYFGKYLDPLNTRYVLFHNDIVGLEAQGDTAIDNSRNQDDLTFIGQQDFIYIFENKGYAPQVFIPSQNLIICGGLDTMDSLNAVDAFDPKSFGLLYLDQAFSNSYPSVEGIVLGMGYDINDIALSQVDDQYIIAPFDYTNRFDPGETWSKADLINWDWFAQGARLSPESWDFDYAKGIVTTYDFRRSLEPTTPASIEPGDVDKWQTLHMTENEHISVGSDGESLVIDYTFDNESSLSVYARTEFEPENWTDYDAFSLWIYGDGSGNNLNFWHDHTDEDGSTMWYGMGACILDWMGWKEVSFDFPVQPRSNVTGFMIALSWDLAKSQAGLGSHTISVRDMLLIAKPGPRKTIVIPVDVREAGQHELYARVFENPGGGEVTILVDGQITASVPTKAAVANFAWQNLGPVTLSQGSHLITLENTFGFNAVNLLALVPPDVAQGYFDSAQQFLEAERTIHILEGGGDFEYENGVISTSWGGKASGGQTLILNKPHRLFAPSGTIETGIATTVNTGDVAAWQTTHNTANEHISVSSDGESLAIDYTFDNEDSLSVYAINEFEPEDWSEYVTFPLWVYGDSSGNNLNFWYQQTDPDGAIGWRAMGDCTLDWFGWRELSFTLSETAKDNVSGFMIALSWDINKSQAGLGSHEIWVKDIEILPWATWHVSENEHIGISSDGESLVIDYAFDNEDALSIYARAEFEPEDWEGYDTFSLYVYGDGSGNNLNLWYYQTGWRAVEACTLDWVGWKEVSFTLAETAKDAVTAFQMVVSWDLNRSQAGLGSHTIMAKGVRLSLEHPSKASTTIHILSDSIYKIGVRALTGPDRKPVVLQIDEERVEINLANTEEGLNWVYLEPIALEEGVHTLEILPKGKCEIDSIMIYSTNSDETIEDIFTANDSPANIVSWEEVNATKYIVHVNAEGPFMLAFVENYNSQWVARVNGREYQSQPLYSVINGFWIDETGALDIAVEYKPQRLFNIGAIISGLSLSGALGYVIGGWWGGRRKRGKLSKPEPES